MADAEAPLDKIHIRDLVVRCIVGINPEERTQRQDVIINITLHADVSKACRSDRIEDTANYKTIKDQIVDMVEKSQCRLIECLAQQVADICLADSRVRRVEVTVDKPGALRFARSVAVEIVRGQSSVARGPL
jgi:D-erythro-7,8-dihydroneopterin triphosphate epimerase